MQFKKLYFLFLRFGFIVTIQFIVHFYILQTQINQRFSKQLNHEVLSAVSQPSVSATSVKSAEKYYIDLSFWLFENLLRAFNLNLHREKSMRILDLGCGPGYFIYIANYFGHHAEGLDLDSNELYNFMMQHLKIKRHAQAINAFQKLSMPLSKKYDLVTAFMICFDKHGTDASWGVEEWVFFITDIQNNLLASKSRLILGLNPESNLEKRSSVNLLLKEFLYLADEG